MKSSLGLGAMVFLTCSTAMAGEPVAYRCEDGTEVSVTFLATDPPVAIVTEDGRLYALPQLVSASGARYASSDGLGATTFWVKGDEARYERPRAAARTCRVVQ